MKRLIALAILFFCSFASAQGKYRPGQYPVNQNPADYTISVHISATHFRAYNPVNAAFPIGHGVYVDAILNGKKVDLFGVADKRQSVLLAPGDYRAMLSKKPRLGGSAVLFQNYYMLLPDKSAWRCEITGFSE
jgi:hypothetical protein